MPIYDVSQLVSLQSLFAGASVGFSVTDANGCFVIANDAFQKITGYSRSDLNSRSYQSITYEPDLPENLALSKRLYAREIDHAIYEKRYVRKPGDLRWVRNSVSVLSDQNGAVINVVALTEDITDFRDARSLRKAHDAIRRVAETTADSALAERCRIAENLEGNTSQLVITLGNHLSRLRASSALNPAEKEALTQIISAAERFVSYLRPLAEILDPPTKVSAGLAKAVSDYARRFTMRTGIDVITDVSGDLLVVDPLLQATIVNAVKIGIAWLAEVSSGGLFLHVYREDTRILVLADGADAKILSGAAEPVGMVHLRHDLRDLGGFVDMKFTNGRCHFRGVIPLDR